MYLFIFAFREYLCARPVGNPWHGSARGSPAAKNRLAEDSGFRQTKAVIRDYMAKIQREFKCGHGESERRDGHTVVWMRNRESLLRGACN